MFVRYELYLQDTHTHTLTSFHAHQTGEASRSTDREQEGLREFRHALKMKRIEKEREEHEWRQKLQMESETFQQHQFESMWQGSERVRRDYEKIFGRSESRSRDQSREKTDETKKKKKKKNTTRPERGASSKPKSSASTLSVSQQRENYLKAWTRFESLRSTGKQYSERDVPWPSGSDLNLFCFPSSAFLDTTSRRKLIRQEYLRWHPDKFKQKFERNFEGTPNTFQNLLQRVIGIAQKLSQMKSQMLRSSTMS